MVNKNRGMKIVLVITAIILGVVNILNGSGLTNYPLSGFFQGQSIWLIIGGIGTLGYAWITRNQFLKKFKRR